MEEQTRARLLALIGVGAMLAFPVAAAQAVPGKGKGGDGSKHADGQRGDDDRGGHGSDDGDEADEASGEAEERSHRGRGRGRGGDDDEAATAGPGVASAKPTKPVPSRGRYNFRGTVVAVDPAAGTLTLSVVRGNRHARTYAGREVTFSVASARFAVTDANADGALDLADVSVGDRVRVMARMSGSELVEPLAATAITSDRSGTAAPAPEPGPEPDLTPEPGL